MNALLEKEKGLTLIELLIALTMSGLLVAGLYRTLMGQQKTYFIQEQVVDMQQNVRAAINRMTSELRMAGFGNVSTVFPVTYSTGTFSNELNPDWPTPGALTFISAVGGISTLTVAGSVGQNQIVVSTLTDDQGNALFDLGNRRYISIGGLESHVITAINNGTRTIQFNNNDLIKFNHPIGTPLFTVMALTYQVVDIDGVRTLLRDENTGDGPQPQADNIENLQFTYLGADGNPTANPSDIRVITVSLTARTERKDPDLGSGGDYRKRQIVSNIHLRNRGIVF